MSAMDSLTIDMHKLRDKTDVLDDAVFQGKTFLQCIYHLLSTLSDSDIISTYQSGSKCDIKI